MTIYHYDDDGIYAGSSDAKPSPLEPDVFRIPAKATETLPPKTSGAEVAVWDESNERWSVTEDHRKTEYYMPDDWDEDETQGTTVEDLGPLPDGAMLTRPDPPAAVVARAATRTALKATWDSQPAWIRGPYRHLLDGASALLDEGDDEAALDLIDEAELSKKSTQDKTRYVELGDMTKEEYFNALKTQFKAAIENL